MIEAIISKAKIHGIGKFKPPELDLKAIKARADKLDVTDPIKADIYMMLRELSRAQDK